jgi:hypothetical protein
MNDFKTREIRRTKQNQETTKEAKYKMKTHVIIIIVIVVVGFRSSFTIIVKLRNFERDGDLYIYTQS